MILEEQILKWQQGRLTKYCKVCSDTCCNGQKHNIMIDVFSLPLFKEKGIPIVNANKVDKSSFRNNQLRFRNGSYIQKPSIVQMPTKWLYGKEWYLYTDLCPFYKEKRCEVHEDPRRPQKCKNYPLVFCGNSQDFINIGIMNTCEYFNKPENRNALAEKFSARIIQIK